MFHDHFRLLEGIFTLENACVVPRKQVIQSDDPHESEQLSAATGCPGMSSCFRVQFPGMIWGLAKPLKHHSSFSGISESPNIFSV